MRATRRLSLLGLCASIVWMATASLSYAYDLGPYLKTPAPSGSDEAVLTVKTPDMPAGKAFSLEELEALGLQQLTIELIWEEESGTYQGVFLSDLLAAVGAVDAPEVVSTASDEYSVAIPQKMWTEGFGLIITRKDGEPLDPDYKGPTRLMFPTQEWGGLTEETPMDYWVWNILTIEAQ